MLSIVVPFHNVEEFFEECLESLAAQTFGDFEVVMVDDGSPDGSSVIAKAWVDRDHRFRLVSQENQGLGPARNTGMRSAKGRYLAFVDADDIIPPGAFELLVGSLEKTGSDIASGNVRRFDATGDKQWWTYAEPFAVDRPKTHVTKFPDLLWDRITCNKVFRRDFAERIKLTFPARMYEDAHAMVRAHVLASSVDVLSEPTYLWRRRVGSITQQWAGLGNIRDRVTSLHEVRDFLVASAPRLLTKSDVIALEADLALVAEALPHADDEARAEIVALGAELLSSMRPAAFAGLPAIRRLRFHLMRRRMLPELLEVLDYETDSARMRATTSVRRGRFRPRVLARYPFFDDPDRAIPDDVFDITDELTLWAKVDRAVWRDGRLHVDGHAHLAKVDVPTVDDCRIRVWLHDPRLRRKIELPVRQVERPDVTARSGQSGASYHGSGFHVEIDPARLRRGAWRPVVWQLLVRVSTNGLSRTGVLGIPHRSRERWTESVRVAADTRVTPIAGVDDRFLLRVGRDTVVITRVGAAGETLEIEGRTVAELVRPLRLVAVPADGSTEVVGSVEWRDDVEWRSGVEGRGGVGGRGGRDFVGGLRLDALAGRIPADAERQDWDLFLVNESGRRHKFQFGEGVEEARAGWRDEEIVVTRTRYDNVRLVSRACRPVVTAVEWSSAGELRLTGETTSADLRPELLVLRKHRSQETRTCPVTWTDDRFTATLSPARMPGLAGELPLSAGSWECGVAVARTYTRELPDWHRVGGHEFSLDVREPDTLRIDSRVALGDDERGTYAQERLRRVDYPAARRRPLRDLVVFDSFEGAQFSCNPKAIFEEIRRRETGLDCVWVSKDGQFAPPEGAEIVMVGSRAHYEALATARFVVGNFGQFPWLDKRQGQTYLQTWHGTPLKRIGHDLKEMRFGRTESFAWLDYEVPRWDLLLSPNAFSTPVLRRAFRYEGEILETGYPRNDILNHPERELRAAAVRERLRIPAGKKVVLYAPTWRDDDHVERGVRVFSMRLDVERARQRLADDHVLLVRTHYLVTDRAGAQDDDFVRDVSCYPDISELYLVADLLVTDYSSAMFDFAVTGKPMVFFTYDLERYRDVTRGFYFDLEAEAPGPVVRTSEEAVEAVRAARPHADAYARFQETYCHHDDGHASARVVDRLLRDL